MIYFVDSKSTILFENRTSEFLLYIILKHLNKTRIKTISATICKKIFLSAASFLSEENIQILIPLLGENVSYVFPVKPTEYEIFDYANLKNFVNFENFVHNFDADKYINNKMNSIYWSYIDRNIYNTIKYRKRKGASYEGKIKKIAESLKNVKAIDSASFLLFVRYRESMEPYFLLHSLLNNVSPVMRVKYYIGETPRACTFGDRCRGGFVFIACKLTTGEHNFSVDYCLCNKHLKELRNEN